MKQSLSVLALLVMLCLPAPARAQDHSAEVKYFKNQLVSQGVDLSGACGAFAITQRVAWDLRFQGYKFLVKQGGNRAILQPNGTCLDGDHASGPGYATDYLISVNEGYVGYDLLGDGGGANNPQWIGPESDPEMVARNKSNFGEPVQPVGGAPQDPTDPAFIRNELTKVYASWCVTPTGPGTGASDIAYYVAKIIETGGWSHDTAKHEDNIGYWTDRIKSDGHYSPCGGGGVTPPPGPSQADVDALKGDIAELRVQVTQLKQALEDKQRQIESVNQRVTDEQANREAAVGQVNLRMDNAPKMPTGCRVQFLACRLSF